MIKFSIADVSSEAIMNIAKAVSNAHASLSSEDLKRSFENQYSETYIRLAITTCLQLRILEETSGAYTVNPKFRNNIQRSNKNDLLVFFRQALQDYPPFLLYADLLSKGYTSVESANMIRGIMQISSPTSTVERSFRRWGIDSNLIISKEDGHLSIPEAEKGLPTNYVRDLLKALDSELTAKTFLIDTISPEVYNCVTQMGLDISELAKGLMDYELNPKQSLERASQFFESYLHKLGLDIGVNLQGKTGINSLINELATTKKILPNQKHIGNGMGGCRNISAHGVDADTQKEWTVTPQGSLAGIIMIPVAIRSFYLYTKKNNQEF